MTRDDNTIDLAYSSIDLVRVDAGIEEATTTSELASDHMRHNTEHEARYTRKQV